MEGRRGDRDPFFDFGDPFAGFGGFGRGFGGQRSFMSDFFGGRNPFDDPFFTRPFGGMFESSFFGPSVSPFTHMGHPSAYLEHQPPEPKRSRGPIIEELDSDGEEEEQANKEKKEHILKHGSSSKEPYVEVPDDEAEGGKSKHLQHINDYNRFNHMEPQPQARSFSFQSSSVTYGGANGAYYTSSNTKRTGSDGVTFEENKEANSATGQASHRVSRGLHNKGHTLNRKRNSDGRVDKMETLHNLNEDELAGFEEAWKGNARQRLPDWAGSLAGHDNMGANGSGGNAQPSRGGWALPSSEHSQHLERMVPDNRGRAGSSHGQHVGRMDGSSNVRDKNGYSRYRGRE